MCPLIFFNNIVRLSGHIVTKVGLFYCFSRREMGAIGLTDKAEGDRVVAAEGGVFKIQKTPRLVERRTLPLKGAHI